MASDSRSILVVDDDPAIRKILSQSLEMEGFVIYQASDGEEALEAIDSTSPDLVILDVMMPKMNGFDVLKSVRSSPTTADLPVVMLTARSSQEDVWEGWREGVDYYMTKPFDIEELLRFVERIFTEPHEGSPEDLL